MKNLLIRKKFKVKPALLYLTLSCLVFSSCKDDFFETTIPSWLGSSIYDQLKEGYVGDNGIKYSFNYYTRLIDDIGYTDVLKKTGSKTVFVADDAAFERFFKNNSWNVKSYDELTLAQKKLILNSSMINNALLIENLATIEGPVKGQALRRATALSVSDTITLEKGVDLPANNYWDRFRKNGVRLAKDATPIPMVHFLEAQMAAHSITKNDFSILFNRKTYEMGDAYIYNHKVICPDITCQNGYIHVLDDVLIPPSNMADVLRNAPETKIFSSFLERYAAPYYNAALTQQFHLMGGTDSVFVKGYFSKRSIVTFDPQSGLCKDPAKNTVENTITFDPGYNRYRSNDITGNFQTDMGVIFAPTDEALNRYFTEGAGKSLIDMYGSIANIPDKVLKELVSNHMKPSFWAATPSLFPTIVDDAQEKMGVTASQIQKVYLADNGVIYVTNTVYPPALYSSVMYPPTINENMRVFNWAINQLNYSPYLLSMVNTYSFFIPTDNFTYIVPTSLKSNMPVAWKFRYNSKTANVYATVHPYDATKPYPDCIGDSISSITNLLVLQNHLRDILDYHIIVGKIESGKEYYKTKEGGILRVSGGNLPTVAGGGDIERNVTHQVSKVYDQSKETNLRGNGKSYIIDQPVQSPTRSVFSILSDNNKYPEFSEFFKLLQGADDLWKGDALRTTKYSIFTSGGLDQIVRFLNTYHYTLYVPVNQEVINAIKNGLPTWDDVEAATDQTVRDEKANQIIRFLRYHFQDNAIFLDKPAISGSFQTATLNMDTETFYKLKVNGGNNELSITTGRGDVVHVDKSKGNYNIMARDFKFNTTNPSIATTIETSSYVVINQVDKCMYFEGEYEMLLKNRAQAKKYFRR